MTSINRKLKSTMTDINNKSWADLCDSSQSSQSQVDVDSPLKSNDVASVKNEDDLYTLVFKPIKKENVKVNSQDDLSLTSFMNDVHMVTPIKQECDDSSLTNTNLNIDEDTICSPFTVTEFIKAPEIKFEQPDQISKEILNKDLSHAKRRLTSECESTVSVTHGQVKKVTRTSIEHKNVHDSVISPPKTKLDFERDPLILQRRQKQIDFGKNTIGYEKYLEEIPKSERRKEHPKTPPKNLKYTRRAWDGLVKSWRVKLHCWDPENKTEDDDTLTTCSSSNLYSHGSMTSLDSNSQASDSRPSTPPSTKTVKHEAVSSHDPIKIENIKTET